MRGRLVLAQLGDGRTLEDGARVSARRTYRDVVHGRQVFEWPRISLAACVRTEAAGDALTAEPRGNECECACGFGTLRACAARLGRAVFDEDVCAYEPNGTVRRTHLDGCEPDSQYLPAAAQVPRAADDRRSCVAARECAGGGGIRGVFGTLESTSHVLCLCTGRERCSDAA